MKLTIDLDWLARELTRMDLDAVHQVAALRVFRDEGSPVDAVVAVEAAERTGERTN